MTPFTSLLKKAEEILSAQQESPSILDSWMTMNRETTSEIRDEWKRLLELRGYFYKESLKKLE